MKYEFVGKLVRATAESTEESVVLLSLNKEKISTERSAIPRKKKITTNIEARIEKKRMLGILKEQVRQIPPGSKGFITSDMARASKDFPSFVFHYGKTFLGKRIGTRKVYGGYEVFVNND